MRCENLGLTPQALRFHRFAVRKAGPRSRVMVVFPAQQKEGARTSQDRQFKINLSPPQGYASPFPRCWPRATRQPTSWARSR
jgi:hypothetical protein